MKLLYQDGFSTEERKVQLALIHTYILGNIKDILQGVERLNLTLSPETRVRFYFFSFLSSRVLIYFSFALLLSSSLFFALLN